jgi:hypothetical protein
MLQAELFSTPASLDVVQPGLHAGHCVPHEGLIIVPSVYFSINCSFGILIIPAPSTNHLFS